VTPETAVVAFVDLDAVSPTVEQLVGIPPLSINPSVMSAAAPSSCEMIRPMAPM
jgi:hypothetical protein